jgi:hypothetical protein
MVLATAVACSGSSNEGPSANGAALNTAPDAAPIGKDCKTSPGSNDVAYGQGRDFFCIAWRDTQADEQSYRVELKYLPSGEQFVYPVAADAIEHFVPQSEWPEDVRLAPGACVCEIARKDFDVRVYAVRASGEVLVGRLEIVRDAAH